MGRKIYPGRYTVSEGSDGFVVFLIGMRINKWWAVHKWLPVAAAMSPMIKELYAHKELGCLSMENFFSLRTTLLIQYWRSEEDLFSYAKGKEHLKAWRNFNRKVHNNEAVGIYHETYQIKKGQFESIYGNMPLFGLGKVLGHELITPATSSALKRMNLK
jgi:hypothetical protein